MRESENTPQRTYRERLTLPLLWCLLALLEGLTALGMTLGEESDVKNAWLFGYSRSRLGMAAVILVFVLILVIITIHFWRNPGKAKRVAGWIRRALGIPALYGPLVGLSLGGVILFCQSILGFNPQGQHFLHPSYQQISIVVKFLIG